MKNIIILIISIFPISSFIFHLWTTYIAFNEGGFFSGLFTLILPLIGEIYWCIKVWGENSTYTTIAIIHFIGAFFYTIGSNK